MLAFLIYRFNYMYVHSTFLLFIHTLVSLYHPLGPVTHTIPMSAYPPRGENDDARNCRGKKTNGDNHESTIPDGTLGCLPQRNRFDQELRRGLQKERDNCFIFILLCCWFFSRWNCHLEDTNVDEVLAAISDADVGTLAMALMP